MEKSLNACLPLSTALERTDDDFWHTYAFFDHGSIQEVLRVIARGEIKIFVLGCQDKSDEALRHENQCFANAR